MAIRTYNEYRAAHRCANCGRQDERTLSGRTYCAVCAAKKAERLKKARAADREADRASRSAYRAKIRSEREAAGLCTRCGKRPAVTGQKYCLQCRDENRMAAGRHRAKVASGEARPCPYMDGLEDLGEYACLHCLRPTCVYDREEER